jgi:hypothetical protein
MQLPRVWLLLGYFLGYFAVCLAFDCKSLLSQIPITAMAPHALAPGKTTRVEWTASALKTPLRVGGSFPMEVQWIHIEPNKAVADIRIPETVRLGPTTLWLATDDGISEPLTILIDDLPSVSDNGANHSPSQPQAISIPCALDGQSDAAQSDFYQVRLNANTTIGIDCVAERIGSAMDSVLRIWDTTGKLLLQSDDSDSGPDSQAQFTAPADGDYLIEIVDSRYAGGGRYRLRISDAPVSPIPYPLAVGPSVPTNLSWILSDGSILQADKNPDQWRLEVNAPADANFHRWLAGPTSPTRLGGF